MATEKEERPLRWGGLFVKYMKKWVGLRTLFCLVVGLHLYLQIDEVSADSITFA